MSKRSVMSKRVMAALVAFEGATTLTQYQAAKRLAGKLDRLSQLAAVDSMVAAYRRVHGGER